MAPEIKSCSLGSSLFVSYDKTGFIIAQDHLQANSHAAIRNQTLIEPGPYPLILHCVLGEHTESSRYQLDLCPYLGIRS